VNPDQESIFKSASWRIGCVVVEGNDLLLWTFRLAASGKKAGGIFIFPSAHQHLALHGT